MLNFPSSKLKGNTLQIIKQLQYLMQELSSLPEWVFKSLMPVSWVWKKYQMEFKGSLGQKRRLYVAPSVIHQVAIYAVTSGGHLCSRTWELITCSLVVKVPKQTGVNGGPFSAKGFLSLLGHVRKTGRTHILQSS